MNLWLGVDYGTRRIGLALADDDVGIASPADTIASHGAPVQDAEAILAWADAHAVGDLVVGLPLNMDGTSGPQAKLSEKLVANLRRLSRRRIEAWDERLSSFAADELMDEAGLSPKQQKSRRDAHAACVILQSFLDARRMRRSEPHTD